MFTNEGDWISAILNIYLIAHWLPNNVPYQNQLTFNGLVKSMAK